MFSYYVQKVYVWFCKFIAYIRELLNIAARANRVPCFQPHWLEPLRTGATDWPPLQHHGPLGQFNEFFIGIDPAGDGFSRMAIVSAVFDNTQPGGQWCVRVLAAEVVGKRLIDVDLGDVIVQHALRVRAAVPELRNAQAVICIENNSILVPHSLIRAIKANPRAINMGYMCENIQSRGQTGTHPPTYLTPTRVM